MPQPDGVEETIIQTARQIADQAARESWLNDRMWTQRLLSAFGECGRQLGYFVCGGGAEQHGGQCEWLYDLVWLKNSNGFITDVPLILESEWSTNYKLISDDFEKLLVGRAQHRVMVFQQRHVEDIFGRLAEEVRNFGPTQAGDRYLFLGWDWTDRVFKSELFVA
jgi:hypothetical protein